MCHAYESLFQQNQAYSEWIGEDNYTYCQMNSLYNLVAPREFIYASYGQIHNQIHNIQWI